MIEASTKAGKTHACIVWLFEHAYAGKAGNHYWWVAPVALQARIAFTRMLAAIPREITMHVHHGHQIIYLLNGAVIEFKSAENPDSLYGEDVYAAVIDEASRTREASWHAVRSTLTATRGPIRIIGNVRGRKNWAYQMARRAEKGEPDMGFHRLTAMDAVEGGVFPKEEVEDARRTLPEAVFRELYFAEASDDQGNPFGYEYIRKCVRAGLSTKEPRYWGWDLAKKHDWTVGIGLDEDGAVAKFLRFQKPWEETIVTIRRETERAKALVDSTGVGDPVLEALQRRDDDHGPGDNFEGYLFSPPSKQKLMEGLAVGIQRAEISYPEGPISVELESFEYQYTRTGVRYSAPEGEHDDCVCALALARQCMALKPRSVWEKLGD